MARLEVEDLTLDVPGRRLLTDTGLVVDAAECVAILGASGVGKTSLLNCIAGISTPTLGCVRVKGTVLSELVPAGRAAFRLQNIGIVFQFGELLPELSLVENVALPLRLRRMPRREAERRARLQLDRLGLSDHAAAHPDLLSGGEIQRAGIARALVHGPLLVLADEPTGMLDEASTQIVAALLRRTARELGVAIVVVTHDPIVAAEADRVLRIRDHRLVSADNTETAEARA